jgi:hypothetical protein
VAHRGRRSRRWWCCSVSSSTPPCRAARRHLHLQRLHRSPMPRVWPRRAPPHHPPGPARLEPPDAPWTPHGKRARLSRRPPPPTACTCSARSTT